MTGQTNPLTRFFLFGSIPLYIIIFLNVTVQQKHVEAVIACVCIGIVSTILTRWLVEKDNDVSIISALFDDWRFKKFGSIGIASLIYSILAGALIGASLGGFGNLIHTIAYDHSNISQIIFEGILAITALIFIPLSRLSLEAYVVVYRVAQKYLQNNRKAHLDSKGNVRYE